MSIWFRGQDKSILYHADNIWVEGNGINIETVGASIFRLGEYNSRTEAMQVLNMIQNQIETIEYFKFTGKDRDMPCPPFVFEMPPAGFSGEEEQRGPREVDLFRKVREYIRQDENYVPRKHETIGGMWTTDTWRKKGIVYQLTDEGYTSRIFSKELELDVIETMHGITWKNGDIKALEAAFLIVSKDKESDSNGNVRP